MEDWKEYKLGEIITFKNGKKRNNIDGCFPIYGGNGILGYSNETNYSNCIIIGRVGVYCGSVFYEKKACWVSDNAIAAIPNENYDTNFCYYLLSQLQLNKRCIGTGQPLLTQEILNRIEVSIPPLATQQKIAAILSSLDDKIELNNKINDNLEQQAQSVFKSWFVDFEPFGGKMPAGWKMGTVSDISELHDSKRVPLSSMQREQMDKKFPYYGATSLMDYVDDYIFDGIYLLLGEDGTVIDDKGFPILQYVEGKFWVNNHAHILSGKNGFTVEMLYLFFSLTNVKEKVTGAVQQKISQGNLNSITAIVPTSDICKKFDAIIQPIFYQIRNLRNENRKLSNLRDTLLPKLMNGEIEV